MPEPLSGFTVGVIADRRRDELAALLERRGARVVLAPAPRIVPPADDGELRAATLSIVDRPPDVVVAGTGLPDWLAAAEGWGLAERLRAALDRTELVGPGRIEERRIEQRRVGEGQRIVVLLHGEPRPEFCGALAAAGAEVVEVWLDRWLPPADPTPLRRLVELAVNRLVDAVAFTSATAVGALLRLAGPDAEALLAALRTGVLAACAGPATAAPLVRRDVPVICRTRLGVLVRALADELPGRAPTIRVAGQEVTLRGHAALVDGTLHPMAPAPMAVLRALAAAPGRVLSRAALLTALPRGADEHAVEMAVARLRVALGGPAFVQTVVKRGYRLRVD
jgi:uroporphyrinogen-III synthase